MQQTDAACIASAERETGRNPLAGKARTIALSLPPGAPRLAAPTPNPGKARELIELLGPGFDVTSAAELGLPEPEETEATFTGNALLQARAAADASGLVALADDSGLSVTALEGAPGVYSARWAGPNHDFVQ